MVLLGDLARVVRLLEVGSDGLRTRARMMVEGRLRRSATMARPMPFFGDWELAVGWNESREVVFAFFGV